MMLAYSVTLPQTTFFLQPESRYLHRQYLALVAGFSWLSPPYHLAGSSAADRTWLW
jgi:hypothetical protein